MPPRRTLWPMACGTTAHIKRNKHTIALAPHEAPPPMIHTRHIDVQTRQNSSIDGARDLKTRPYVPVRQEPQGCAIWDERVSRHIPASIGSDRFQLRPAHRMDLARSRKAQTYTPPCCLSPRLTSYLLRRHVPCLVRVTIACTDLNRRAIVSRRH